ncbi:MAG TPA: hypothetical protein VK975_07235 [Acidimicrobiales bacterium]|nr:hypothetical protein [Acidimicrobiales bacterium]
MAEGVGRRFSLVARDIVATGPDALRPDLITPEELAKSPAEDQQALLEELRVELYAISSVVADATVRRARHDAEGYPPYGLARSMYSQLRAVVANPEPYPVGSIASFHQLGTALVDTVVLHLDRELNEQRLSHPWMVRRLEHLLSLFRVRAGPMARPRMRDSFSFLYGGLHFGAGVCVQLTEVMARLLHTVPGLPVAHKVDVIIRSSRPALQLAALNIDQVVVAHHRLQAPQRPGRQGQTWMDSRRFVIEEADGAPWRIELRPNALDGRPEQRRLDEMTGAYPTQGCPARISLAGGSSAIAQLWTWSVELARDIGLLGDAEGHEGEGTERGPDRPGEESAPGAT